MVGIISHVEEVAAVMPMRIEGHKGSCRDGVKSAFLKR